VVRVLVDYRPALRARTGVGEYIHEVIRALGEQHSYQLSVFASSWKDRLPSHLSAELSARVIDLRIPGRALNLVWHRLGWPPVEWLAGSCDVVHAAHPLLIPARHAAQVVTIHDLFFLTNPTAQEREIRRDYPTLASAHARRAHAVVTSSAYGRMQVVERLGVDPDRVHIVSPGAPRWRQLGHGPNLKPLGYVLFVGTIEPRKNLGALLDAWALVLARRAATPRLVLAGGAGGAAQPWLSRLKDPALKGSVEYLGYVPAPDREALYAGARVLVLPSLDEGFGLPVLEAMSAGVPVVATTKGAVPEVTAGAAVLVDPADVGGLAAAIERVLDDEAHARTLAVSGLARARAFTWERAAEQLAAVYASAVAHRKRLGRAA
jgi:glycosyltransferase involved in cell wall biosynthesis